MAKLSDRLAALEMVKNIKCGIPLIMIVKDGGITESQKLQIAEAEATGQNIIMIMRDTHDPSLHSP